LTASGKTAPARKPRADARKNRDRLIEVAKASFRERGGDAPLEDIARRAGVGIGTLYRHFPTRDALIEAVYRQSVGKLAEAAPRLLAERPPGEALHAWLRLYIDYIAHKRVLAPSLKARPDGAKSLFDSMRGATLAALTSLVERAAAKGEIRPDVSPTDLLLVLVGVGRASSEPGWSASAERIVDVLMDGLRRR